jgi:hypothetical protein
MFSDSVVILAFFLQAIAYFFIVKSFFETFSFLKWKRHTNDETQILLERKTYLISSLMQMALLLQMVSFIVFFTLLNHIFPPQIKGAMCGAGVVSVGAHGENLLSLKLLSPLFFAILFVINFFDLKIANMPFTPQKFIWLVPLTFLSSLDLFWTFSFIDSLTPNLVTNCCSAQTFALVVAENGNANQQIYTQISLLMYGFSAFGLIFLPFLKNKFTWFSALLTILFIASSVFSLKYFFVSFIYNLPAHYCLFDLFLAENNYLGYFIFGAYYFLFFFALKKLIYTFSEKYFAQKEQQFFSYKGFILYYFALIAALSPIYFWLFWQG